MVMPELKQIRDLSLTDFQRHPVWVGVRNLDFGKPWYEGSNKDTYRPWTGALPDPDKVPQVRVVATFELRDGTTCPGFIRAIPKAWDVPGGSAFKLVGFQLPCVFVNEQRFAFWGGPRGIPVERRHAFYAAIGKAPRDIFPMRFYADPKLAKGILSGQVDGFYRGILREVHQVEL